MAAFSDRIIELVRKTPGLTDRELTDRLKGPAAHPSQVNQEARLLERRGVLRRMRRHDGIIGNYMGGVDDSVTARVSRKAPQRLSVSQRKSSSAGMPSDATFLISCAKSKRGHSCAAKDMYVSPLFQKMLAVSEKSVPKKIFILSARYGLLKPDQVIEPYELTLKSISAAERRAWSEKVLEKLRKETDLHKDHYVFLAGRPYREGLAQHMNHYSVPMEGLSFGRQLRWLSERLS